MDPYENHDISPLDVKKKAEKEASAPTVEAPVIIEDTTEEAEQPEISPIAEIGDSLVEHISDLRKQLLKSLVVFIGFFAIVLATINYWFPYITRGYNLIVLGPLEIIKFYMSISTTLALGLSLPFLIHFVWAFIKPGLEDNEAKFLGLYSPVMFLLFIGGIAFGFFVVNPLSYKFLIGIGAVNFDVMVSASEYVHFLMMTTIPLGFLFELPIVALFLATIGVLSSTSMKIIRGWSYITMAVTSALITPPDFFSQLIVLVPMALLYEISIFLVKRIEIKEAKKQNA